MHLFRQLLSRIASKMSRKLTYPAAERNKQPILNILKQYLTEGKTLEIASGSGQHVAYFAQHLPYITFQPSEYEECLLESISAHITESQVNNVNKPILIDVTQDCATWKLTDRFNYIYNANMMHISPYKCTENLFINAGKLLDKGLLITYGPYAKNGVIEPQSNIDFDRSLRYQNPQWGLRDINDLEELAKKNGLLLLNIHDMPSNNKILIWKKI